MSYKTVYERLKKRKEPLGSGGYVYDDCGIGVCCAIGLAMYGHIKPSKRVDTYHRDFDKETSDFIERRLRLTVLEQDHLTEYNDTVDHFNRGPSELRYKEVMAWLRDQIK